VTVVARLNIGNSTTEAVVARAGPAGALTVLAARPDTGPRSEGIGGLARRGRRDDGRRRRGDRATVPLCTAATASPGQTAQAAS
jgi:hypothetical protein